MKRLISSPFLIFILLVAYVFLNNSCTGKTRTGQKDGKEAAVEPQQAVADTGWIDLFNGRDIEGWEHVGDGYMTVEEGIIRNGSLILNLFPAPGLGLLRIAEPRGKRCGIFQEGRCAILK
jgi:hypothetical protein